VGRVARLAAREPGIDVDSGAGSPPERWAMIERLFEVAKEENRRGDRAGRSASKAGPRRLEVSTQNGVLLGDLWLIE
jgi:hypothetical protein